MSTEILTWGELRSLLHRPSIESWEELLLQLYLWSYEDRLGDQAHVLPYCARQIASWPRELHLRITWRWMDIKDRQVRSEILRWVVSREQPTQPTTDAMIEQLYETFAIYPRPETIREMYARERVLATYDDLHHDIPLRELEQIPDFTRRFSMEPEDAYYHYVPRILELVSRAGEHTRDVVFWDVASSLVGRTQFQEVLLGWSLTFLQDGLAQLDDDLRRWSNLKHLREICQRRELTVLDRLHYLAIAYQQVASMLPFLQHLTPSPENRDQALRLAYFIAVELYIGLEDKHVAALESRLKMAHQRLAKQILRWISTPYLRQQLMWLLCEGSLDALQEEVVSEAYEWIERQD